MNDQINKIETETKDLIHRMTGSVGPFSTGMKAVMEETVEYSKRSFDTTSSFFQQLMGERSLETALKLQSDFAKSQYEDFIGQIKKISGIYQDMGKHAFKPLQSAIANEAVRH